MNWGLIVTIILTVGFGVATIILAYKLARRKKPVYAYITSRIIGLGTNAPPELKLTFNENPVSNVYETELIFFNRGNESIRKNDVTDAITMCFEGARILREPRIVLKSGEKPRISLIKRDDNTFEIDFVYLGHNDGAVIEVLHTKCDSINPNGNIIDAGEPHFIGEFTSYPPVNFRANVIMGSFAFVIMLVAMWISSPSSQEFIGAILFLVLFTAIFIIFTRKGWRFLKFPNWSRPKK
jgi:hypothetical protein